MNPIIVSNSLAHYCLVDLIDVTLTSTEISSLKFLMSLLMLKSVHCSGEGGVGCSSVIEGSF